MDLDTRAQFLRSFYRHLGVTDEDDALTELGENTDEVAYEYLTRGTRAAQRWMLRCGYAGWRKRSSALSFSGSDSTDGGRYASLPADFLRAYGSERRSALVEPNGRRWGCQIEPVQDHLEGDLYYISGDRLWLARNAHPPTTLYLDYHYLHPEWTGSLSQIDFPLEARPLIVAEAAYLAMHEDWLPGGPEMEMKIDRALRAYRNLAMDVARQTKETRNMQKPRRFGDRY